MKRCKHCNKRVWFFHVRSYHFKCVHAGYIKLKERLIDIEYLPRFKGEREEEHKPVTMKEYKEMKKDFEELQEFLQNEVLKYAKKDKLR